MPTKLENQDGQTTTFTYDQDSLLTQAGELSPTRDNNTGQVTSTALGAVTTTAAYNLSAEPAATTTRYNQTDLLKESMTRDHLGRITSKSQTTAAGTNVFTYAYDPAGRLRIRVEKNNALQATYQYDANSNRVSSTTPGSSFPITATYDAQDRQLTHGRNAYTYTTNGDLKTKTNQSNNDQTTYSYDSLGALTSVALPDSQTVTYKNDPLGRRVLRDAPGALNDTKFIYGQNQGPLATVSNSGLTVKRFIYATSSSTPDYMTQGAATYRLVKDHLGSVRMVVNAESGTVVQELTYDEFGNITTDSNPGLQPFGFAGGLYDQDTGLTRFGARDYDAETGRWTAKDPIGFAGGDTNLYGYVINDPINFVDPSGLWKNPLQDISDAAAAFGDGATSIPFTDFSGTRWLRQYGGYDDVVDYCSGWYKAGYTAGEIVRDTLVEKGLRGGNKGPGREKPSQGKLPDKRQPDVTYQYPQGDFKLDPRYSTPTIPRR